MACKKSALVSAINTYAAARTTGDQNLVSFGANYVGQLIDTLDFEPEEEEGDAEVKEAEPA